jgi:flagellar protein FlaJ
MLRYFYETVSIIAGVAILLINVFVIIDIFPFIFPLLNVIGGIIAVVPSSWIFYKKYKTNKQIEQQFIVFIRDLTEAINSGMTLPMALKHCSKRNYLALSPYINHLTAQVDWGIPFKRALEIFAKKTKSVSIGRAVTTIIETYKVGGRVSDTLNAVGRSLIEIGKIREERTASVHAQIVTSYLIYFVFIFILVILQTFLIPALSPPKIPGVAIGGALGTGAPIQTEIYTEGFINFIIVQGFFAGLVTGKMAEGSIVAGFKHSVLLIATGYTLFSFASQFQIKIF